MPPVPMPITETEYKTSIRIVIIRGSPAASVLPLAIPVTDAVTMVAARKKAARIVLRTIILRRIPARFAAQIKSAAPAKAMNAISAGIR